MFPSNTLNSDISMSCHAAIVFLTRPLHVYGCLKADTIQSIQSFLRTAMTTSSHSRTSSHGISRTKLFCSPNNPPPLPIHLACVEFGIFWSDWILYLGGSAFTLFIEPSSSYVIRADNGKIGVIWSDEECSFPKNRVDIPPYPPAPISIAPTPKPALDISTNIKTLWDWDADSNSDFTAHSPSSRPSSRSSYCSTLSSSSSSSATSYTTVSSTKNEDAPLSAAKPVSCSAGVTKPGHTRYLYQGGSSTVLSGGVMLGSPPSSTAAPTTHPTESPTFGIPNICFESLSGSERCEVPPKLDFISSSPLHQLAPSLAWLKEGPCNPFASKSKFLPAPRRLF